MTLNQEVPDTITEWVAGAVCTSETAGLGISEPAPLTSFQPFFLSYTLPYSMKRGETLVLKVSVRNYNQHDLPVGIPSRELRISGHSEKHHFQEYVVNFFLSRHY